MNPKVNKRTTTTKKPNTAVTARKPANRNLVDALTQVLVPRLADALDQQIQARIRNQGEVAAAIDREAYGGVSPKTLPAVNTFEQGPPPPAVDQEVSYLRVGLEAAHEALCKLEALISSVLAPETPAPVEPQGAQGTVGGRPPYSPLAQDLEGRNVMLRLLIDRIRGLSDRVQLSVRN